MATGRGEPRIQDPLVGSSTADLGGLDIKGIRGPMSIEGGTDTDVLEPSSRTSSFAPAPGDVVVLDDVGAHEPDHFGTWSRRRAHGCRSCRRTRPT